MPTTAQFTIPSESPADEVEKITEEASPDSATPDESIPAETKIPLQEDRDEDSSVENITSSARHYSLTDVSAPQFELSDEFSNSTESDLLLDVHSVTEPSGESTPKDPVAESAAHYTLTMITVIGIYLFIVNT